MEARQEVHLTGKEVFEDLNHVLSNRSHSLTIAHHSILVSS